MENGVVKRDSKVHTFCPALLKPGVEHPEKYGLILQPFPTEIVRKSKTDCNVNKAIARKDYSLRRLGYRVIYPAKNSMGLFV